MEKSESAYQRQLNREIKETLFIIQTLNTIEACGVKAFTDEEALNVEGFEIEKPTDWLWQVEELESWNDELDGADPSENTVGEWRNRFQKRLVELTNDLTNEVI